MLNTIEQGAPKPGVSAKYQFVSTREILNALEDRGWEPFNVQIKHANKVENQGYEKHLIRLRNVKYNQSSLQGVVPEIVLMNSHDAGNSFQLMAGMFRVVCSNGLITATNLYGSSRIVHVGYAVEKVYCAVDQIEHSFEQIISKIKDFQQIELSREETEDYAVKACLLRWEEGKLPSTTILLRLHRQEDTKPTLWNVYNVIQENMLRGAHGGWYQGRRRVSIRATRNIDLTVKINLGLWKLAEEIAVSKVEENKQAVVLV